MDIDKDGQEYTPIVANYFKVVEILLYRKIKDKVTHINQKGIEISNAYTVKGLVHDFNSNTDDSLTLGEMAKFLNKENRLFNENRDANIFNDKLRTWIENVRNSHFHKDLILSKSEALSLKMKSLIMINDILEYL